MKKNLLFIFIIVLTSCKSNFTDITENRLFGTYHMNEIRDLTTAHLTYRKDYVVDRFTDLGTVCTPQYKLNMKYDTLSRYHIIINGTINFKKGKKRYTTKDIKSVTLSSISVWKLSKPRRNWKLTKDSIISPQNRPIPYDSLLAIKDVYLFVNKNLIVDIKKDAVVNCSYPITRLYKLY